jgi:AraC family transcriptional regulator
LPARGRRLDLDVVSLLPRTNLASTVLHDGADPNARELSGRFGFAKATTLVSSAGGGFPISIARLQSDQIRHAPTRGLPGDHGYSVHVWLSALAADLSVEGRAFPLDPLPKGRIFLFDLMREPVGHIRSSFRMVRFHFPGSAFETLAAQNDESPARALRPTYGTPDPVLEGLATALLPALNRAWEVSPLFVDQVALAVHSHLTAAYGPGARKSARRPGLLPWQERRVKELVESRLDGNVSLATLAQECRMSTAHFSRAFSNTTGQSPHQWLLERRIAKAQELLKISDLSLAAVADACGFFDASHLCRFFSKRCGIAPAAYRRSEGK